MAEEDLQKNLKELREQIDTLREALGQAAAPYAELAQALKQLQDLARGYFRVLDLLQRYGTVSPEFVVPGLKDDISRHIVVALFEKGNRNVSQVTEAVKAKRGTASRRIVRARLDDLVVQGVVTVTPGTRGRTFRIADETAAKWSRLFRPPAPDEGRRTRP